MHQIQRLLGLGLALTLSGCGVYQQTSGIDRRAESVATDSQDRLNAIQHRMSPAARADRQVVNRPWIAGRAQPLAREVSLPPALRADVQTTAIFGDEPVDLLTIAERIQTASRILVRVTPDALLPAGMFLPRLTESVSTEDMASAPTRAPLTAPVSLDSPLPGAAITSGPARQARHIDVSAAVPTMRAPAPGALPLSRLLDAVSLRLGVYWRYDPDLQAITLYRVETRTFDVKALTLQATANMALGLTSGGGGQADAGGGRFESASNTTFTHAGADPIKGVKERLEQFMTRGGTLTAAAGATSTVVITDTPEVLDRIAAFLEHENRDLSRRVTLVFEEVTLEATEAAQAGIDWNLLFSSAGVGNVASLSGLTSLIADSAATATGTVGSGQWAGSSIGIRALSEFGKVVVNNRVPVVTGNREPVTHAMRETFSYIESLQQTQSYADTSAPTVSVSQREETVGTFLTVVPDAQRNGSLRLTISYDNTRLLDLERQVFGSSSSPSYVQSPRVSGVGTVMTTVVAPGVPVVIAGHASQDESYQRRRLDKGAPIVLGGSDAASSVTRYTLLLLTAMVEEGH